MRILAIDPGYERLGVAVLEKTSAQAKETLVYSDCVKTSTKLPHAERLALIKTEIERIILQYQPNELAIETLFFNTNQKTAIKVAEARGAVIATAASAGLTVCEFGPGEIKVAVTGYGKSDKQQVTAMTAKLIRIDKEITYDDEYDAIAIGLTALATQKHNK